MITWPFLLPLVATVTLVAGYFVAKSVPEELPIAKPYMFALSILSAAISFAVLPWWQAAICVGLVLLGTYPALLTVGWLSTDATVIGASAALLCAYSIGVQARIERRPTTHLFSAAGAVAVVFAAIQLLFFS